MNKGTKGKRPGKASGKGHGRDADGTHGVDPAYLQEAFKWYNSIPEEPVADTRPTVTKFTDDDESSEDSKKGEDGGDNAEGADASAATAAAKAARAKMMQLKQQGADVLDTMVANSKTKRTGSSEEKWLRAVSQSGTMSDRVGAAVMLVKSAPFQSAKSLDTLLTLAKKKGEGANLVALDALRGLFLEDLLPEDRRLHYFREQPWQAGSTVTRQHLLYWYFEEELKLRYAKFVSVLGECSKSTVQKVREVSIKILFDLLNAKPEQEKQLLTLLVNKMGDPERKVASKAVFLLHQLLNAHPNMKFIVVREVELFAFRSNVSQRAQYYSMIFLNQIILLQRETTVSVKLVEVYFKMFTGMLETTGARDPKASKDTNAAVHSRILSAILTGMNRAIPFVPKEKLQLFDDNVNDLYRLVHSTSFSKSVQILFLLLQIYKAQKDVPDRYFSAVYSRLHAEDLGNSKRVTMFLNVLYQTMKVDKNKDRVFAFVKRILQLCLQEKPSLACGALFMISEVFKVHRSLWTGVQQPEDSGEDPTKMMDDDDEEDGEGAVSKSATKAYDPMKRDPRYARAPKSCFWELTQLEKHYHPSVKVLAKTLRSSQHIDYGGDPMQDFAMVAFLDKFVYKNPKKRERLAGGSIMQSTKQRKQRLPLNSEAFLSKAEQEVAGDELFFYRYFQQKATEAEATSEPTMDSDDDVAQFSASDDEDHVIDDFEDAALMGGPDDSDSDDAPEFDYGDMDLEEDEDLEEPDEKLLEQMLMDEGSDLEDDDDDEIGPSFAAAEEYEHLFDEDKVNPKQERWESERANKTASRAGSKRSRSSGGKSGKRRRK